MFLSIYIYIYLDQCLITFSANDTPQNVNKKNYMKAQLTSLITPLSLSLSHTHTHTHQEVSPLEALTYSPSKFSSQHYDLYQSLSYYYNFLDLSHITALSISLITTTSSFSLWQFHLHFSILQDQTNLSNIFISYCTIIYCD